jgi:hypothetical protein
MSLPLLCVWWGNIELYPDIDWAEGFQGWCAFGCEDKNFWSCTESKPDHPAY